MMLGRCHSCGASDAWTFCSIDPDGTIDTVIHWCLRCAGVDEDGRVYISFDVGLPPEDDAEVG